MMDHKQSVSCSRNSYSVDHNMIREASDKEDAVIDAYQEESEWAERNQAAAKPDYIKQKV